MKEKIVAAFPELEGKTLRISWRQSRPDLKAKHKSQAMNDGETLSTAKGTIGALELKDLSLKVQNHAAEGTYDKDCTCTGDWLQAKLVREVGPAIEAEFTKLGRKRFVEDMGAVPIRLQMDGAGGHGGGAKIEEMKKQLKVQKSLTPMTQQAQQRLRVGCGMAGGGWQLYFNIDLVVQPPNSPEMNVLDLGVWRSMQAAVCKLTSGQRMDPEILAETCMKMWEEYGESEVASERYLAMECVWEKLMDIARVTQVSGGENLHDEGKKAGARKRVRDRRAKEAEELARAPGAAEGTADAARAAREAAEAEVETVEDAEDDVAEAIADAVEETELELDAPAADDTEVMGEREGEGIYENIAVDDDDEDEDGSMGEGEWENDEPSETDMEVSCG